MNTILNIDTATIERDGLTRTATYEYAQPLYNKVCKFTIPNYCVQMTNSKKINMMDIRLELDYQLDQHSKTYHVRITDVGKILGRIHNNQINFNGDFINKTSRDFFYKSLMILDFCSESYYFTKYLQDLSKCTRLPKEALDLAKDLASMHKITNQIKEFKDYQDAQLKEFWESILASDKKLLDFETRVHKQGIAAAGDIILPFTKLITNKKDVGDVERINTAWAYCNRVEEKPTVAYIPLSMASLSKESTIDTVVDYIKRLTTDVVVMKVKNLKLTEPSSHTKQRELFAKILEQIARKKRINENLLTVFLEAGDHVFPLPVQAFDVVSASANLFDKETPSGGRTEKGYGGKAIDEETLALWGFDDWQRQFETIGEFPCTHDYCRKEVTTMDKSNYSQFQWYVDLRKHNILTLSNWMHMIGESVTAQMADLTINRIRNSPYAVLTELLSRNYEYPHEGFG